MTLAITSIQRNRESWIKEWIVFHYLVGFRKFYLYLHQCTDNTADVLLDLKKHFDIEILPVSSEIAWPQIPSYRDAYERFGNNVDWMAFIDGDEFLFPTSDSSIEKVLNEFTQKDLSAIGVYWACFGSSGFQKEPDGLIIENYRYRAANGYHNNRHIKSLIKGGFGKNIQPRDPHLFQTSLGTFDENLRPITSGWTDYEPSYQKLRINHYVTQSRSFFESVKSKIQTPDGSPLRDEAWWEEHDQNDIYDTTMDIFIKPLREILKAI